MDRLEITNYRNGITKEIGDALKINTDEAARILEFMQHNINPEFASVSRIDDEKGNNNLVTSNGLYYINIKITLLVLIAYILDIKVTNGILSLAMALTGINTKGISKISPEQGETCILKEVIRLRIDATDRHLLECYHGECINNDINCAYRDGARCCCSADGVQAILDNLCDKNVLEKQDEGCFMIRRNIYF